MGSTECESILGRIRLAADWLLRAQNQPTDGDGYSRRFKLYGGWDKCYIETSGYIIPTLFDVAEILGDDKYARSSMVAGDWLLEVQRKDGSFTDIDKYSPHVFDTGQVLLGLNSAYRKTGAERFLEAAVRAADWLVEVQHPSGAWIKHAYMDRPHAYYSRVAAGLMEVGIISDRENFVIASERNLNWVLSMEQRNGYFQSSNFRDSEDALLHTIVYVLEGFVIAYRLDGASPWRDAIVRGANVLRSLADEQGLMYSQYDANWKPTNKERCVTGLAQLAGFYFDAAEITGDNEFLDLGLEVVSFLNVHQIATGNDVRGALPSSIPIWGHYGGMEIFNWNVKFYIDALIKQLRASTALSTAVL